MRCQHKASRAGRGDLRGMGKWSYAQLRHRYVRVVHEAAIAARLPPDDGSARLTMIFVWHEDDRHRDPDGVSAGGRKIVLDGLVKAGALCTDGVRSIAELRDRFVYVNVFEGRHRRSLGVLVQAWETDEHMRWGLLIPHKFPSFNELLAARELGARRSLLAEQEKHSRARGFIR